MRRARSMRIVVVIVRETRFWPMDRATDGRRRRIALLVMRDVIKQALAEDVGKGDATSKLTVPRDAEAKARIDLKEEAVIAGMDVAEAVFREVDKSLRFMALASEGAWSDPGPVCAIE